MSSTSYKVTTEKRCHDPGFKHMDYWTAMVISFRRSGYGRGATEPAAIRDAVDDLFEVREVAGRPRP